MLTLDGEEITRFGSDASMDVVEVKLSNGQIMCYYSQHLIPIKAVQFIYSIN